MGIGLSLHIGVNDTNPEHYGGWSGPLESCHADAEVMYDLAQKTGFEPSIILSAQATREAVGEFIDNAAASCNAGDIVLITYAGHGGQVTDIDGDEADGIDESWCLYNGQLLDDELSIYWSKFAAGVRILVISDSCHSGSVTKGTPAFQSALGRRNQLFAKHDPVTNGTPRFMPRDVAQRVQKTHHDFYDDVQKKLPKPRPPVHASVRLLSGCQDDQYSCESNGHGNFTRRLLEVWAGGSFKGTYSDMHRQILAGMKPDQTPNHAMLGEKVAGYDEEIPFTI